MESPPTERLAEARRTLVAEAGLADEAQQAALEHLTRVAVETLSTAAAFVSLVGGQETFFRCSTGLRPPFGGEVDATKSILRRLLAAEEPLAIEDVRTDEALRDAWEVSLLGAVALLAVPLVVDGIPLGTLAVIDPAPRAWSEREQGALADLADVASRQISIARASRTAAAREAERAERALLDSETRFRTLVEYAPDGILMIQDDRIAYANPAALALAGASSAGDLVGRPADLLLQPPYLKAVRAGVVHDRPQAPGGLEDTLTRIDGGRVDVEVAAHPYLFRERPAVLLLLRDIGARKRADLDLRRREAQLRLLVEQLPVLVWSTDAELRITSLHGGRSGLRPTSDPVGAEVRELFGSTGVPLDVQHGALAGRSGTYRVVWQGRTWEVRVDPLLDARGDAIGTVGVAMDVSHQIRAAEQLRAAEHLASVGELAGGVAHEMNNVLAAILATAEALERSGRAPTRAELDVVKGAARRGAEITGGLLGFARKGMYRRVRVSVADLLDRLAARARDAHPGLRVERVGAADLPDVEGDPEQLEIALGNLCQNAVEAMPDGGTLSIVASAEDRDERADLGLAAGRWVRVEVRDTGIGMTDAVRRRAIEPFFTTRGPGEGVGLGLSMAYGVIRNHGGQLALESEPGAGTTVTVHLPAAPVAVVTAPEPPDVLSAAAPGGVVLVVDDDEWVRFSTGRLVEALGYETIEATGGEEGLAAYRARGPEIVAVLLDLRMPGMDGAEALRRLVALDPDVRVVLCTGYERDQVSQGLFELGRVGFLGKPFGLADLEAQLRAFARAPRVPARA